MGLFNTGNKATGNCLVANKLGLHARPACLFVQKASEFRSEITVKSSSSEETADGKSLMSVLMLAAVCGSDLTITAEGEDAHDAISALIKLIESKFDEE